jgi:hypothetical protein
LREVALVAAVAGGALGCRDAVLGGERVGDPHVLRGRALAFIVAEEETARRFVSRTPDLAPLQDALGARLGLLAEIAADLDEPANLLAYANAERLVAYDVRTARTNTGSASLAEPFFRGRSRNFRREYKALCQSPLFASLFPPRGPESDPCDPLNASELPSSLVRLLDLRLDASRTTVRWERPGPLNREPLSVLASLAFPNPTDPPGTCGACSRGFVCPPGGAPGARCVLETARPCTWDLDCAQLSRDGSRAALAVCTPAGVCDLRPRTLYTASFDASPTAPVLATDLYFETFARRTTGGDLLLAGVGWVEIEVVGLQVRAQPRACTGAQCSSEGVVFQGATAASPAGDRVRPDLEPRRVRARCPRAHRSTLHPGLVVPDLQPRRLRPRVGLRGGRHPRPGPARAGPLGGQPGDVARAGGGRAAARDLGLGRQPRPRRGARAVHPRAAKRGLGETAARRLCDGVDDPARTDDDGDPRTGDVFASVARLGRVDLRDAAITLNPRTPDGMPETVVLGGAGAGAPSAGGGAGELLALSPTGTPRVRVAGTAGLGLGSGPLREAGLCPSGALLDAGSPLAFGGDGALVAIASSGAVVGTARGGSGEFLGAALSERSARGTRLVGAPEAGGGAGAVYECTPAALALTSLGGGEPGDRLGAAVVTVDDLDGDGGAPSSRWRGPADSRRSGVAASRRCCGRRCDRARACGLRPGATRGGQHDVARALRREGDRRGAGLGRGGAGGGVFGAGGGDHRAAGGSGAASSGGADGDPEHRAGGGPGVRVGGEL